MTGHADVVVCERSQWLNVASRKYWAICVVVCCVPVFALQELAQSFAVLENVGTTKRTTIVIDDDGGFHGAAEGSKRISEPASLAESRSFSLWSIMMKLRRRKLR